MISITARIRKLVADFKEEIEKFRQRKREEAPHVPTQWTKDVEKIRERAPGDRPEALIKERVHELKTKSEDRTVKRPGLFLRDIGRLIGYVEHQVKDPTKQGLKELLEALSNEISTAAKKGEYVLPKEKQIEILESAGKLKDTGELVKLIADLFAEAYAGVRATLQSVTSILRKVSRDLG
jgi:hypothetical protein